MLELAPHNGVADGLLAHQLDSDHFSCADLLFTRACKVFGQPVMAEVIVEGRIGFYRNQIRVAAKNKCPKIAPDFGPDSTRGKGRIVALCNLSGVIKMQRNYSPRMKNLFRKTP